MLTRLLTAAHDTDPGTLRYRPIYWLAPTGSRDYRRCSYCGSMHPEDLLRILTANGEKLEMAAMKFGWPHKFWTEAYERFLTLHLLDASDEVFAALNEHLKAAGADFKRVGKHMEYRVEKKGALPC
jgi:hypothetical protein